jgi:hypothetical protein
VSSPWSAFLANGKVEGHKGDAVAIALPVVGLVPWLLLMAAGSAILAAGAWYTLRQAGVASG